MNCAERIEAVFRGEMIDRVPFALKGWRTMQCGAERELRNDGMGIIDVRPVHAVHSPNVQTEVVHFVKDGQNLERTVIRTPVGNLTTVSARMSQEQTESTSWMLEAPFKKPEDYKVLRFMAGDQRYTADDSKFLKAQAQMEGDAFFKTVLPGVPLHTIMYAFMGVETFSMEWDERRDELLALHDLMTGKQREIYQIASRSPALVVQCGGNYASEVLGKHRFVEHVVPHWNDVCAILHEGGKLVGCHLDANNGLWAAEIGASDLDWIEAFTPAPDTDMTVADARAAWKGKTLFINFPSSMHLEPVDGIVRKTREILRESAPGDRFIVGVTENVPENRWRKSFRAILDTCNTLGKLPIDPESL